MALLVTQAIVLRYVNYRETSRILTVFSRDLGKLTVSAKGCMRPKSRERAAAEMLVAGEYTLSERSGRYTLTAAQVTEAFYPLRLDLDRLAHATYFAELCESVLGDEDPQPALYDLLRECLSALCRAEVPCEVVRAFFEVRAMDILGFRPELSACAGCGAVLAVPQWFSAEAGGILCVECKPEMPDAKTILPGTVAFLRQLLGWQSERIGVLRPADAVLRDMGKTWRPFLRWHLERSYRLDDFIDKLDQPESTKTGM